METFFFLRNTILEGHFDLMLHFSNKLVIMKRARRQKYHFKKFLSKILEMLYNQGLTFHNIANIHFVKLFFSFSTELLEEVKNCWGYNPR